MHAYLDWIISALRAVALMGSFALGFASIFAVAALIMEDDEGQRWRVWAWSAIIGFAACVAFSVVIPDAATRKAIAAELAGAE